MAGASGRATIGGLVLWLTAVIFALEAGPARPHGIAAACSSTDTPFRNVRQLSGLPQRPGLAVRRGRVNRERVARIDDGQLVARSVLAGVRPARDDRSSVTQGGDRGRMRHLSHADGADARTLRRRARRGIRAPANRTVGFGHERPCRRRCVLHTLPPDKQRAAGDGRQLHRWLRRQARASLGRTDLRAVSGRRGQDPHHALCDRGHANGEPPHPAVGAVRHVSHAVHEGSRSARARSLARCQSRCPISSGSTARIAPNGAASRATCRKCRSRRPWRQSSANRGPGSVGTRSSAATSSCSAC